ncbi:radical SAM domain protein [Enhygromyxa salina]|uniref:Radical SAM domain protein n=1 Tax=Enhygromyxa salina TaxID=215803 RepID=A0A0C2D2T4_9BACT|nr:radical SAM protein [Enhygromyxa salina]KIG14462.1 radical SAM domain protein [Enhygromyxa salina]
MANIGYIQVVRHCNHFCGFCSNPTTPYSHTFESMKVLVDDFVERGYFGVILTGGEPSLHPELPKICQYASDSGLHVRMITNGTRMADKKFAKAMADAGLKIVHVSIYSVKEEVEDILRGTPGTLPIALQALDNAAEFGIDVNMNCVINKLNADHLDLNIRYFIEHHPYIRHFVWNNLDPSMGRAEVNQDQYTPRLAEFELSLHRGCRLLQRSGRTFRIEKVPLCYMTDFAWASTETRKIVKSEERIVHFLDDKQTVRQREWGHKYAPACEQCSLRSICGGVFDRGNAYDPAELSPVFVSRDAIVETILRDPTDPSFGKLTLDEWKDSFDGPPVAANNDSDLPPASMRGEGPTVGAVTDKSRKLFEAKRRAEGKKAEKSGVSLENTKLIERALTNE